MEPRYQVVLASLVTDSPAHEQKAAQSMARLFGLKPDRAIDILRQRPVIIRRDAPLQEAERVVERLRSEGIVCRIEVASAARPGAASAAEVSPPKQAFAAPGIPAITFGDHEDPDNQTIGGAPPMSFDDAGDADADPAADELLSALPTAEGPSSRVEVDLDAPGPGAAAAAPAAAAAFVVPAPPSAMDEDIELVQVKPLAPMRANTGVMSMASPESLMPAPATPGRPVTGVSPGPHPAPAPAGRPLTSLQSAMPPGPIAPGRPVTGVYGSDLLPDETPPASQRPPAAMRSAPSAFELPEDLPRVAPPQTWSADDDLPLPTVQQRPQQPPPRMQAPPQPADVDLDAPSLPAARQEAPVALPTPRPAHHDPFAAEMEADRPYDEPASAPPSHTERGHHHSPRPSLGPLPDIAPVELDQPSRDGYGPTQLGSLLLGAVPIMAVSMAIAAVLRPELVRVAATVSAGVGLGLGVALWRRQVAQGEEMPGPMLGEGNAGVFIGRLAIAVLVLSLASIALSFGTATMARATLESALRTHDQSGSGGEEGAIAQALLVDLAVAGMPLPDPEFGDWPDAADADKQCKQQKCCCDPVSARRWMDEIKTDIVKVIVKTKTYKQLARAKRELHFTWVSLVLCIGIWFASLRDRRLQPLESVLQAAALWLAVQTVAMWTMTFLSPLTG